MKIKEIVIYTDGSCHTQKRIGAWAAILLLEQEKIVLKGHEINTTHNRMELLAVIMAIKYVDRMMGVGFVIQIFTDSQYVMNLMPRSDQLELADFITRKGEQLPNADLLKNLISLFKTHAVYLNKVKAHSKTDGTINYNREVDRLSRSQVRALVREAG